MPSQATCILSSVISVPLPAYSASSDWFFPLWPLALWPEQAALWSSWPVLIPIP